jgi:hypothetical protein
MVEWDKLGTALPEEIHAARMRYADRSDDNIEVDDDAKRCPGVDRGLWVQAWVWITPSDIKAARKSGM